MPSARISTFSSCSVPGSWESRTGRVICAERQKSALNNSKQIAVPILLRELNTIAPPSRVKLKPPYTAASFETAEIGQHSSRLAKIFCFTESNRNCSCFWILCYSVYADTKQT